MKEIQLTQGKKALVDDEDFEYLCNWKWYACYARGTFYAAHKDDIVIYMHRLIMKTPKGLQVDHTDHNGLNNQKSNLRNCLSRQNRQNSLGERKYKGVYCAGTYGYIVRFRKRHIGTFKNEEDAARAYNEEAIKLYGEYACLNTIKEKA